MTKKPELLAPAGGFEALRAAVGNGADAVYLGGTEFSARAGAVNFDREQLRAAIDFAHDHGVKAYIAVNTLIYDEELPAALEFAWYAAEAGANALIVQDLGLIDALRQILPEVALHASTQMTVASSGGAKALAARGISRVVLARELSLAEIGSIVRQSGCPIEIFVHGALCISYSGQCLLSSLVGGRSGNRGSCAQPCRLKYRLLRNGETVPAVAGEHLLSPRDLNTLQLLPQILATGVAALKIEGRMKRPEYVATVVRIYRAAIDVLCEQGPAIDLETANQELAQIFSRDFCSAYLLGNPGRELMSYQRPNNRGVYLGRVVGWDPAARRAEIALAGPLRSGDGIEVWTNRGGRQGFTIETLTVGAEPVAAGERGQIVAFTSPIRLGLGDRVFKTLDRALSERAQNSFQPGSEPAIPVRMGLAAAPGERVRAWALDRQGNRGEAESDYCAQPSVKYPATAEQVQEHFSRLGGTAFTLDGLETELAPGLLLPRSVLNELRRSALAELTRNRRQQLRAPRPGAEEFRRRLNRWLGRRSRPGSGSAVDHPASIRLAVSVGSFPAALAAVAAGADQVYLPAPDVLAGSEERALSRELAQLAQNRGCRLLLTCPRVVEEAVEQQTWARLLRIRAALQPLPVGILVNSLAARDWAAGQGLDPIYSDLGCNLVNRPALLRWREEGAEQSTLSLELNLRRIQNLGSDILSSCEIVVYGEMMLMISRHCVIGALAGAGEAGQTCRRPCRQAEFALRDRLGLVFPLGVDRRCRMQVYNSKVLNLLEQLPQLLALPVRSLRLELQRRNEREVAELVAAFKSEINRIRTGVSPVSYAPLPTSRAIVERYAPAGTTRGHLFRGAE